MRIFGGRSRSSWVRLSKCFQNFQQRRPFCKTTNANSEKQLTAKSSGSNSADIRDLEGYRDLDKLDFMKAAKILFTTPPKKKKFGIDFHLVQLFFACMPSLAVYLVAQYAHYEMRKMEAELEVKKKAEEEKAKEMEASAAEGKEIGSNSELLKVQERLHALEETVKDIVVETKKQQGDNVSKNPDARLVKKDAIDKVEPTAAVAKGQPKTEQTTPLSGQRQMSKSVAESDAGLQDPTSKST
ncbi:hypothetical protein Ancab_031817 [Ancistrocladus abbreviatus]